MISHWLQLGLRSHSLKRNQQFFFPKPKRQLLGYIIIEGSLEVKLPTIWTDEKQRWEESEKRRRKNIKKEQVSEERRSRKGRKVAKHCVF